MQSDTSDSYWKGDSFASSLTTSHWSVVTSLFRTTPPWSARQQQQMSFAEFTSDITHTPGQENVVADALSRPPPAAAQQPPTAQPISPAPTAEDWPEEGLVTPERPILAAIAEVQAVDFPAMAAAQRSCPEVAEMMNSTTLQITNQEADNDSLLGDVSTQRGRLRQVTFNNIINVSIWPPALQRPAAEPTQPLSLPPQSLGGTCGGVLSVPAFPALIVT